MLYKQVCLFFYMVLTLTLIACGGSGGDGGSGGENESGSPTVVTPITDFSSSSLPQIDAISANPSPEVSTLDMTLLGDSVVYLEVGDEYVDFGAVAFDQDGADISFSIDVTGNVNTDEAGDYLLRYSVENDGLSGSIIRIIRVQGESPIRQTQRSSTLTNANLSYLEHLPIDYSTSQNTEAPLIIFNHGSGATGTGRLSSVECCGIPELLDSGDWDDTLPFVVLSPQRTSGQDFDALDDFLKFALENYDVDPNRVYMAGWSEGGFVSVLYGIAYPEKLAALAPLAGGLFFGVPQNVCDAADIPTWMYLGDNDSNNIRRVGNGTVNALNDCDPQERVRVTTFNGADHFETSIWPFEPQGNRTITASSDPITEGLLEWFLLNSND